MSKFKFLILNCSFTFCVLTFALTCLAQDSDLEFSLDVTSNTTPLPKIFKPNIDLSGRGFHRQMSWPQELAAQEVLEAWEQDIGFNGLYRLQYNLWEINQLAKDKEQQDKLLANYENIIRKINAGGGIVILDLFGTPAGLGKVLDKKSPPWDPKAFKELVKTQIRNLSCQKRYNIWYEIWNAPDLDDFFLGRKQEYFNLYRALAESVKELEAETKIHIPIGGPSTSWWFQNLDGNTILTAENSLIYELIRFCAHYKLPLNFISWHTYSTYPKIEKGWTIYNKTPVALIRDWLSYFNFDRNLPLIVDEWNYDRNINVSVERKEKSFISSSYIPSRIKNMYEAGLDYQLYFSLEDFQNNKEAVVRNVGIFWFDPEGSNYKGGTKYTYNVFKMLANLGSDMFSAPAKFNDEFVGVIATKGKDYIAILVYNYIDPDVATSFLSKNIATLNGAERKMLLNLIKTDKLEKILAGQPDMANVRPRPTKKVKNLLKKVHELNAQAAKFNSSSRNLTLSLKNLKANYLYQRYAIDSSCSLDCEFTPLEKKEVNTTDLYQETLTLSPYSVNLIVLKQKPPEEKNVPAEQ